MIPWWGWLLILVFAIGVGIASVPLWFNLLLRVASWGRHLGYAREARKHNAKARALRLARTEWRGLPLPPGDSKEGQLVITQYDLIHNPERISTYQFERAYFDRGLDMKVDLQIMRDVITRDIVVLWRPHKGRWPKERY